MGVDLTAWSNIRLNSVDQIIEAVKYNVLPLDDRWAERGLPESAYAQVTRVYRLARLHVNFFQPVEQLLTKTRQGARTHRV
jgi:hypothetical protein